MKLSDARRVVMFNYNDATKTVDMRHYGINVKMTGVSKGIKSLLVNNRSTIPAGMSDLKDISEYVLK